MTCEKAGVQIVQGFSFLCDAAEANNEDALNELIAIAGWMKAKQVLTALGLLADVVPPTAYTAAGTRTIN